MNLYDLITGKWSCKHDNMENESMFDWCIKCLLSWWGEIFVFVRFGGLWINVFLYGDDSWLVNMMVNLCSIMTCWLYGC